MPISVNGELVDDGLIRQETALMRARLIEAMTGEDAITIDLRASEWARENIIERMLLRQAAIQEMEPLPAGMLEKTLSDFRAQSPGQAGCAFPAAETVFRQEVEIRLRVDHFVAKLTAKVARPSKKEVFDCYRKHQQSFYLPELVHAAHILKNVSEATSESAAFQEITHAQAELRKGRPFATVADELSDCPGRGGELGFFARGQMVDEFDEVIFRMSPGEISDIFRTPFGFHIAKLLEKRPEGIRSFDEVRGELENRLIAEKRERIVEEFVDRMRAKAEMCKVIRERKQG